MFYNNRITDLNNYDDRCIHYNDGWYPKEEFHIWSGVSSIAEIDFSVETDSDIVASFNIVNNLSGIEVNDMNITVNYVYVDFRYDKDEKRVTINIRQNIIVLNNKITSICIDTRNVSSVEGDSRRLGICISDFRLSK